MERALENLRDGERVDLMITDYAMPRTNGMELATAARDLRPDLPILFATGYAELPSAPAIDLPRIDKPYHQQRLASHWNCHSPSGTPEARPVERAKGVLF